MTLNKLIEIDRRASTLVKWCNTSEEIKEILNSAEYPVYKISCGKKNSMEIELIIMDLHEKGIKVCDVFEAPTTRIVFRGCLPQSHEDSLGVTYFKYDTAGRKIEERSKSKKECWAYDDHGNLIDYRKINLYSKEVEWFESWEYDSNGNILKFEAPTCKNIYTYDKHGLRKSLKGDSLSTFYNSYKEESDSYYTELDYEYFYDENKNLIRVTNKGEIVKSFKYDSGNKLIEKNKEGFITTYEYDSAGRLIKEQRGYILKEWKYDEQGNKISFIRYFDNEVYEHEEWEYDESGLLVFHINYKEESHIWKPRPDGSRALQGKIQGFFEQWEYNKDGKLVEYMNSSNEFRRYTYKNGLVVHFENEHTGVFKGNFNDLVIEY